MIKFIGLDGKNYQLDNKSSSHPLRTREACKSNIQYECGQFLKEKYPMAPILEEVPVPKHDFIFDFFLPTMKMVVEINGEQHYEYNPFFHKSKREFVASQHRDFNKEQLCSVNNWQFISVRSLDELKDKINGQE